MTVTDALARRASVRAYRPEPVEADVVSDILEKAQRAPSGGNLQPWRVWALAGESLAGLKALVERRLAETPYGETREYDIYPDPLGEPYVARRYESGEDLYGAIGVARDDIAGRTRQFMTNFAFFDAPVGLFFCIDRGMGPPQWADLGMYMQSVMLLAVERGLDTCAQESWALWPKTVAEHLALPPELMVFAGMALGFRDEQNAINRLRTRRAAAETCFTLEGFG